MEEHDGKMCPFRIGHFCSKCVLYQEKAKTCTLVAINWNMGRIAHALEGTKLVDKPRKKQDT